MVWNRGYPCRWCGLHSKGPQRRAVAPLARTMGGSGSPLPGEVIGLFRKFSQQFGAQSVLMDLALGLVHAMPFPAQDVALLRDRIVAVVRARGLALRRQVGDRDELPVDFRYIDLLLRASGDPERHLGGFAQGVKSRPRDSDVQVANVFQAKKATEIAGERPFEFF